MQIALLSIIMIDAMLIYTATMNAAAAIITAALLLPATTAGRWIYVT